MPVLISFFLSKKTDREEGILQGELWGITGVQSRFTWGELVVTEVGVIKKEIAYHGDVINTTARIQAQCNTFDTPLLISGELFRDLPLHQKYLPSHLGEVLLKGKEVPVQLHSVKNVW